MRLNPGKLFMLLRSFVLHSVSPWNNIYFISSHFAWKEVFVTRSIEHHKCVPCKCFFSTRLSSLVHIPCKWWLLQPLTHVSLSLSPPTALFHSLTYGLSLIRLPTIYFLLFRLRSTQFIQFMSAKVCLDINNVNKTIDLNSISFFHRNWENVYFIATLRHPSIYISKALYPQSTPMLHM